MPKITSVKTVKPEFQDSKSWYDAHLSPQTIDHNDQDVYKLVYHERRFPLIFQFTGRGAQQFFKKAKAASIIDVAALTSVYRPGPLAAGIDKLWIECENKPYEWGHPLVNETLKETRNLLVFQEGVMKLASEVGGFPPSQTDDVRRAIMKRNADVNEAEKEKIEKLEADFVTGAVGKGIPESTAKDVYQRIKWMSGYSFNRCISPEQEIYTYQNGEKQLKQLKDVQVGDTIQSYDEKLKQNIFVQVKNIHNNGNKKLVKVKLIS